MLMLFVCREPPKESSPIRERRRTPPPPPRRQARLSKSNAACSAQADALVKGLEGANRRSKAVLTYALIPASLANTAELWVIYSNVVLAKCSSLNPNLELLLVSVSLVLGVGSSRC
jgi:hypothetical protein